MHGHWKTAAVAALVVIVLGQASKYIGAVAKITGRS
jgi:hypothetical protein